MSGKLLCFHCLLWLQCCLNLLFSLRSLSCNDIMCMSFEDSLLDMPLIPHTLCMNRWMELWVCCCVIVVSWFWSLARNRLAITRSLSRSTDSELFSNACIPTSSVISSSLFSLSWLPVDFLHPWSVSLHCLPVSEASPSLSMHVLVMTEQVTLCYLATTFGLPSYSRSFLNWKFLSCRQLLRLPLSENRDCKNAKSLTRRMQSEWLQMHDRTLRQLWDTELARLRVSRVWPELLLQNLQNFSNRTYQTEVLSYMPCHSDVCVDLESWERELEREFVSQLHAVVESIWKQVEHVSFVVLEKGCECREKKSLRYRTHKTTMKAIRREEEEIEFDFGWSNLFFLVMFLFCFSRLPYTAVVERWWKTKCIANQNLLKWW